MLDARVPLYHQLADELFAQIRAGAYPPREKIPSEHALAGRFGVGRPTVRQATETLIQRGVLVRRRGSGTFVRSVPVEVDLFALAGTLSSFAERGIALESALLGRPRQERVAEAAHPLDGREAVRLSRLSSTDGQPVLLEEIDLDAERFPGLARKPLKGRSLSEIVETDYRLRVQSADQSFRVERLDRARAARLGLAVGAPVLRVDRTLHFVLAPAAVFARMFCRTDRFVFSQRIQGERHG